MRRSSLEKSISTKPPSINKREEGRKSPKRRSALEGHLSAGRHTTVFEGEVETVTNTSLELSLQGSSSSSSKKKKKSKSVRSFHDSFGLESVQSDKFEKKTHKKGKKKKSKNPTRSASTRSTSPKSKSRNASVRGYKKKSKNENEKGYDSDGVLGGAREKARAARNAERERRVARKEQDRADSGGYASDGILGSARRLTSNDRKKSILDDLDAFDHRESLTIQSLQKEVAALAQQIETGDIEKSSLQKQLNDEIDRNDELGQQIRQHQVLQVNQDNGIHLERLKSEYADEKKRWENSLNEKDLYLEKLQSSIKQMLVNKEVNPSLLEGDRELLMESNHRITDLEERVDIQRRTIDELTFKLSEQSQNSYVENKVSKQLKEALDQSNKDRAALKIQLEQERRENQVSLQRKDEAIVFFQQELTKLKKTEGQDGDLNYLSPTRGCNLRRSPNPERDGSIRFLDGLISPFTRTPSFSSKTEQALTSGEEGVLPPL